MNQLSLRRTFVLFHITLGIVIFVLSVRTAMHAGSESGISAVHLIALGLVEAAAAVLFLIPKTLRAGAWMLLGIFALAILLHGVQHELSLLVYAAGVLFVCVHGSAYGKDLFSLR